MTPDEFRHRYGPCAVVTGATDGIGRAIAGDLARRGLDLVLVARRESVLESVAAELSGRHGVACTVVATDLASADGCRPVLAEIARHDVGVLVAAAGFGTAGPFEASPMAPEREMLAVNCGAVLELTGALVPRLVARRRGGIVLFGSLLGFQGAPGSAHYAATKAWVQTFAEGLRVELSDSGVDILASAPGPVATGFAARADLRMSATSAVDVVARQTLDALGRRGTVRPGGLSKLLGWSLATLPRAGRVAVIGRIMRGMTAHRLRQRAVP